jgi:hypothetical protein
VVGEKWSQGCKGAQYYPKAKQIRSRLADTALELLVLVYTLFIWFRDKMLPAKADF